MGESLPISRDDDDEMETLDDMDPGEREELESCIEKGLQTYQQGDRSQFIDAAESLKRLKARR